MVAAREANVQFVMPANTGIQVSLRSKVKKRLDSGLGRNDGKGDDVVAPRSSRRVVIARLGAIAKS
jgi:hypothetical protein